MRSSFRISAVVFSLLGTIARAALASVDTVSDWSPPSSNLVMRISGPRQSIIDPENGHFYVKCEVRNLGPEPVPVRQDGRLYLLDATGKTNQCKKFTDGVRYTPVLGPGETTTWWQNGIIPLQGDFQVFLRLDADENLCSPTIPISLTRSLLSEEERTAHRDRALQEHFMEFPVLVPNTNLHRVALSTLVFTNDPVIVDGLLYQAFTFTVPEPPADLAWAFVLEEEARNRMNFYILPEHGTMEGFSYFNPRPLSRDIPGIGKAGDTIVLQQLDQSCLVPGQRYLIWFQCMFRDLPYVALSLNFIPGNPEQGVVFDKFYDQIW